MNNPIAFRTLEAYYSGGGPAMTAFGPMLNQFLKLAAIIFLSTAAFSQAIPKYDPATEGSFKGVVQELKFVPPTVEVFLCPKKFLDDMGMDFKANDAIEVTGSKVKQDGADLTLAREVVKGGDTMTLRFKDGKPAW
jgi:hypothetical protein